jgi:adenylate cyclase
MGGKSISRIIWVAAPPILLIILAYLAWPTLFTSLDAKLFDLKLRFLRGKEISREIVHVDVDDKSLKYLGVWPWDRKFSAQIVDRLSQYGAAVIVFDVLYASKGRSEEGNRAFFEAIKRSGKVVSAVAFGISASPDAQFYGDDQSAEALYARAWPLHIPQGFELYKLSKLSPAHVPLLPIIQDSREIGHVKSLQNSDGVHRSVPLVIQFEDRCIPSLGLAALVTYLGADSRNVRLTEAREIEIIHPKGRMSIPVDAQAGMLIHWQKPWKSFRHYTVMELLHSEPDPSIAEKYRNKIVVIGVTTTGATDFGLCPLSDACPLSRIHSNALNTMLTGNFIRRAPSWPFVAGSTLLALLFCSTAGGVSIPIGLSIAALVASGYVGLVALSFSRWFVEIPTTAPLLLFALPAAVSLVVHGISSESEAAKISKALERYLSPKMLSDILKQSDAIDLSTKRKELTVLFADIAGFSTISESVDVNYLEQFLNDFFEAMTRSVFDNNGTVDKFLGDGVLAFFGEPIEVENHALAAVAASRQMQKEMGRLNEKWSGMEIKEFEKGVRIRIGITTGMIVVGNIGSHRRMEYTVLGSAVNLASRLQRIAEPDGIVISARTFALAKDKIKYRSRKNVRVRGFDRDITVYELDSEPIEQT